METRHTSRNAKHDHNTKNPTRVLKKTLEEETYVFHVEPRHVVYVTIACAIIILATLRYFQPDRFSSLFTYRSNVKVTETLKPDTSKPDTTSQTTTESHANARPTVNTEEKIPGTELPTVTEDITEMQNGDTDHVVHETNTLSAEEPMSSTNPNTEAIPMPDTESIYEPIPMPSPESVHDVESGASVYMSNTEISSSSATAIQLEEQLTTEKQQHDVEEQHLEPQATEKQQHDVEEQHLEPQATEKQQHDVEEQHLELQETIGQTHAQVEAQQEIEREQQHDLEEQHLEQQKGERLQHKLTSEIGDLGDVKGDVEHKMHHPIAKEEDGEEAGAMFVEALDDLEQEKRDKLDDETTIGIPEMVHEAIANPIDALGKVTEKGSGVFDGLAEAETVPAAAERYVHSFQETVRPNEDMQLSEHGDKVEEKIQVDYVLVPNGKKDVEDKLLQEDEMYDAQPEEKHIQPTRDAIVIGQQEDIEYPAINVKQELARDMNLGAGMTMEKAHVDTEEPILQGHQDATLPYDEKIQPSTASVVKATGTDATTQNKNIGVPGEVRENQQLDIMLDEILEGVPLSSVIEPQRGFRQAFTGVMKTMRDKIPFLQGATTERTGLNTIKDLVEEKHVDNEGLDSDSELELDVAGLEEVLDTKKDAGIVMKKDVADSTNELAAASDIKQQGTSDIYTSDGETENYYSADEKEHDKSTESLVPFQDKSRVVARRNTLTDEEAVISRRRNELSDEDVEHVKKRQSWSEENTSRTEKRELEQTKLEEK